MVDAEEDVLDAQPEIGDGDLRPESPTGTSNEGLAGVRRVVLVSPLSRSMRTSTSVRLPGSPSIAMVSPAKPVGSRTVHRST